MHQIALRGRAMGVKRTMLRILFLLAGFWFCWNLCAERAWPQAKTQNQLSVENVTNFPSCGNNCITGLAVRSFNNDIIYSTWNLASPPASGVTAGTYGPGLLSITVGADGRLTAVSNNSPTAPLTITQPLNLTGGQVQPWCGFAGCGTTDEAGFLRQSVSTLPADTWETGSAFNFNPQTGNLVLWTATTGFTAAQEVYNTQNNVYKARTSCTSGSSQPTGTGSGITDGFCVWDYQTTTALVGKWNVQVSTELSNTPAPNFAGGILDNFKVFSQANAQRNWSAEEIRVNNAVANCAIASGDKCHGLLVSALGGFTGTNALGILNISGGTTQQWQNGLYIGPNNATLADIRIDDSAPIGISLTGTYSSWAVQATGAAQFTGATLGTLPASPTATPTQLNFDQSYTSSNGSNPKIVLNGSGFGANQNGLGVGTDGMEYLAGSGFAHSFYVNGTAQLVVNATTSTVNGTLNYNNGAVGSTCTVTGSINILVQGVAHKIPVC